MHERKAQRTHDVTTCSVKRGKRAAEGSARGAAGRGEAGATGTWLRRNGSAATARCAARAGRLASAGVFHVTSDNRPDAPRGQPWPARLAAPRGNGAARERRPHASLGAANRLSRRAPPAGAKKILRTVSQHHRSTSRGFGRSSSRRRRGARPTGGKWLGTRNWTQRRSAVLCCHDCETATFGLSHDAPT